jgi:hypothetical protein
MIAASRHALQMMQKRGITITLEDIDRHVRTTPPVAPGDNGNLVFRLAGPGGRFAKVVTSSDRCTLVTAYWQN